MLKLRTRSGEEGLRRSHSLGEGGREGGRTERVTLWLKTLDQPREEEMKQLKVCLCAATLSHLSNISPPLSLSDSGVQFPDLL